MDANKKLLKKCFPRRPVGYAYAEVSYSQFIKKLLNAILTSERGNRSNSPDDINNLKEKQISEHQKNCFCYK